MSGFADVLKSVAPSIATALMGPLAGAAVSFLAKKFDIDPALVQQTVANMGPSDLIKMKELDNEFKLKMEEMGLSIDMAQIGVNAEEAKSQSMFVAGWRPFVGWVGGVGFAYVAIIEPIARFAAQVGFRYTGAFPVIDTMLTLQVLGGLLGLAGLRSYDKKQGTSSK